MIRMLVEMDESLVEELREMVTISGAHVVGEEIVSDEPTIHYTYDNKTECWATIRKLILNGYRINAGYNGHTEEYWIKAKKTGDQ